MAVGEWTEAPDVNDQRSAPAAQLVFLVLSARPGGAGPRPGQATAADETGLHPSHRDPAVRRPGG